MTGPHGMDAIVLRGLRTGAQGASTYMRDLAHSLNRPELVTREVKSAADMARIVAIARAMSASKHCEEAAKEMASVLEHLEEAPHA